MFLRKRQVAKCAPALGISLLLRKRLVRVIPAHLCLPVFAERFQRPLFLLRHNLRHLLLTSNLTAAPESDCSNQRTAFLA